jgi:nitroreductase/NAD-dependent dihydropyrimidine dehydrogenase PreA subunit
LFTGNPQEVFSFIWVFAGWRTREGLPPKSIPVNSKSIINFILLKRGKIPMISIDSSLCIGCAKCTKVCPVKVLEINDKNKSEAVRQKFCIHCIQCMSVCSTSAITADFTESVLGRSTKGINMPTDEQVENLMLTRRSIRAYSDKTIEREKIERLLKIAAHAPRAHNWQNVKFIVVGPDKKDKLESLAHDYFITLLEDDIGIITREAGFKILLGAPFTIALYADKSDEGETNLSMWNCIIEAQSLLLAAHGMGLGGCYNGLLLYAYNNYPKLQEFFSIPEDKKIYMFVALGYPDPAIKYKNIIVRKDPDITWK